jgi:hypothetical protein
VITQHNGSSVSSGLAAQLQVAWDGRDTTLRRPLLRGIRISGEGTTSIREFQPFFSHISLYAYEGTCGGGLVDWDAVEGGLAEDLFDGR